MRRILTAIIAAVGLTLWAAVELVRIRSARRRSADLVMRMQELREYDEEISRRARQKQAS